MSAAARWDVAGLGIAVANVNVGMPTSLYRDFPNVAYGAKPVWSPDGHLIAFNAFTRSVSAIASVWIVPVSGGLPQLLIRDAYNAVWSPDGKRIAS